MTIGDFLHYALVNYPTGFVLLFIWFCMRMSSMFSVSISNDSNSQGENNAN